MKVVPLGRAEHGEHDRVLRLWSSDLCGGGVQLVMVVVAGRALNNQVSCCAWHRCIQPSPHCWSLSLPLVTECQTAAAAALQPRNRGNQGDVAQLCVMQRWKRIFAKFEVSQSQRKTLLRSSPPQSGSSHIQQAEGPSWGLLHE